MCLGCPFCRLEVHGSSLLWNLLPVGGVGLVACQGFLVTEAYVCDWWVELELFSLECNEVSSSEFGGVLGLAWLSEASLLMLRAVFLLCWRMSLVCLALDLVGSWVKLGFIVGMEAFG